MNYLKSTIILLLSLFVLGACSDDDEAAGTPTPDPGPSETDYIDQNLQGKIIGEDWAFNSGIATSSYRNDGSYLHTLSLRLESHDSTGCWFENYDIQNSSINLNYLNNEPLWFPEETIYDIDNNSASTDLGGSFLVNQDGGPLNITIQEGKIEITEVDTVSRTVSGRMAVNVPGYPTEVSVNGNFTVNYCEF